jgi:hypothetical protein
MPVWTLRLWFRRHYSPASGKRGFAAGAETANVFCANELKAADTLHEIQRWRNLDTNANRGCFKFAIGVGLLYW